MKYNRIVALLFLLFIIIIASGCMPGSGNSTTNEPARFFMGIWHGWIAPFSLIASAFNSNIRIYEVNNIGWIYDLGFYMAIISGFGGLSLFRKKNRKTKEQNTF